MYPGTKFILRDDSVIKPIIANTTAVNKPMYMSMFTSDRGPEKFTILEGDAWAKAYLSNNTPNFNKHGQPLLQAALSVNAGAKMFSKRIVADDAKLANKTLMLAMSTIQYAKIGYQLAAEGDAGALTVRSTTHIVAANEVDLAKIDTNLTVLPDAPLGKRVKTSQLYVKCDNSTPGRILIIAEEKSAASGPTFILSNDAGLGEAVEAELVPGEQITPETGVPFYVAFPGDIVYVYPCLDVKTSSADGYTLVTEETLLYYQGKAYFTAAGKIATDPTDGIKAGSYVKEVETYIGQTKALEAGFISQDSLSVENYKNEEDGANVFLNTIKSWNLVSAIKSRDGLSDTEVATISSNVAIDDSASTIPFAVGDFVTKKGVHYVLDDDHEGGQTIVEAVHVIDPTTEIDIKDVTGIKVKEYDKVVRISVTERGLVLRPIVVSFTNTDVFYQGVNDDKEYLYGYAQKDIKGQVIDPSKFDEELIIYNPDYSDSRKYRLYNDPSAQVSDGILFPLFTIFDSGRGISDKYFSIEPNYSLAKSNGKMIYTLNVIDGATSATIENWTISIDANGVNTSLKKTDVQTVISGNSNLIDASSYYDAWDALVDKLAEYGVPSTVFSEYDIMNKKQLSGKAMNKVAYTSPVTGQEYIIASPRTSSNPTGYAALAYDYDYHTPALLENGSYGAITSMNENPGKFYTAMHEALTGVFSKDIYNFDLYTFDCIFDANYDNAQVKLDIQNLACYRNDCVAFMDMGTSVSGLQQVKDMMAWDGTVAGKAELETDPKYFYLKHCAVWVTDLFYDMKNPFDGRQITVTATMGAALRMVNHFINGFNRPFAGKMYQIEFPEAIEGTVNYIPKIYPNTTFTPDELDNTYPSDAACITNEKQEMNDIKVNYASYLNGVLTMETLFTTYDKDSELSYVNNVMTVQTIMKKIREKLPSITRYGFMDSDSLAQYKADVQDGVIDQYAQYFATLRFKYIEDEAYAKNKIFYGALEVQFKPFSQSEIIKVTVLNNDAV